MNRGKEDGEKRRERRDGIVGVRGVLSFLLTFGGGYNSLEGKQTRDIELPPHLSRSSCRTSAVLAFCALSSPVINLYDRRYWPTWKVMEEWRLFVLCIAIFARPSPSYRDSPLPIIISTVLIAVPLDTDPSRG